MIVLHVVKTSDGARWAAQQAKILTESGIDIHVAMPKPAGEAIPLWDKAGATIHIIDCSLPVANPLLFSKRAKQIKSLISEINPDLIHSHFVTTTIMLRLSLGRDHPIPRLFQVPGPLHMEHRLFRWAEIASAGKNDRWIASSRFIYSLYRKAGIDPDKLYLSYYGMKLDHLPTKSNFSVRDRLGISPSKKVVGNVNFMYPPKYFLGQLYGLKRHEDVIDAIGLVCDRRPDLVGALVGGQWGKGTSYEKRLRKRAQHAAGDRIQITGRISGQDALSVWPGFDCAVHVPQSENCGGVIEPLAYNVPVIASNVGGLPEIILDGITGWIVPMGNPQVLAETIEYVLDHPQEAQERASRGNKLVQHMFDINRTALEIVTIYENVLTAPSRHPAAFDSHAYIKELLKEDAINKRVEVKTGKLSVAHVSTTAMTHRYLLLNQLLSISNEGYKVTAISSTGDEVRQLEAMGIEHRAIPMTRRITPLADVLSLWRLYKLFRQENYDIVHTHNPKPGLIGQLAARLAGVPIVINTVHGFYFSSRSNFFMRQIYMLIEKIAAQLSSLVFFVNQEDMDTAVRTGICPPDKMKKLGPGGIGIDITRLNSQTISQDCISATRKELGLEADTPLVGFVGRLVEEKGVLDLLKAARIVQREIPSVRFLIVGPVDKAKSDAISPQIADDYGVSQFCIFTGLRQDIPELMALMHVLALPSHREGFPVVPMEASAMGIPCVVTDIRGCREAVENNRNGLLVPVGDVDALAWAIIDLLMDKEKAHRMGKAGRKIAEERFDERIVFNNIKAEYERLILENGFPAKIVTQI